ALGLAAAPSPAGAGTGVVLRSRALGVYDSLAAGFRASYRGSVADLVLGEADDPALGSRIAALHPGVVVSGALRAALFPPDPLVAAPEAFHFLLKLSLDRRIPLLTFSDALVRAGALAAACPDFNVVGEQLAEIVRRIQAGERPGDIPVSRARRVRWWFNRS